MKIKKKIGNILIGEKINSGGFGLVYSGIDTSLNRKVAVKVIDPKLTDNKDIISFFKKEAITQGQMNHPNIVSVYSFNKYESTYYIVFEYVEGNSLKSFLEKEKRIKLDLGISYIKQILRGLHYAHSRNFVHFDIKPANILITSSNIVKIIDFGIAQLCSKNFGMQEEQWFGTPIYSSPEQILGLSSDFRSDIYSFGISMFEMLTGSLPFSFDIEKEITKENIMCEGEIKFPPDLDLKTKKFIDIFLLKAMKRDVELRYQNVLEMLEFLDNIDESL